MYFIRQRNIVLKMLFKVLVMLTFLGSTAAAFAGGQPFDQARFDPAMAQGRPIVVYFHGGGCPACRTHRQAVDRLAGAPDMGHCHAGRW
jgi:thiol-disulfide isomerase/thioredoxin